MIFLLDSFLDVVCVYIHVYVHVLCICALCHALYMYVN